MRFAASGRTLAAVAAFALCSTPALAQAFEGVVDWDVEGGKHKMTQSYKGSAVRMDITERGHTGVMLMDGAAQKMTMIMPDQQMYMVMDLKGMGQQHADAPPKITAMGKTETIAGRTCEVYRVAEAGKPDKAEMCVAKGMGYFMMGSGPMAQRSPLSDLTTLASSPEYARLYRDGFFPLRIATIEGGTAKTVMIATKVEPKPLDAALFQVPAGLTEMKMPAGMTPQ